MNLGFKQGQESQMSLGGEKLGHFYQNGDWLFRDVTIGLAPGEVLGISGYSGSGKTTLAKVLAGYIQPKNGCVKMDEKAIAFKGFRPVQLIHQHPEKAVNPKWRMKEILQEPYTPDPEILDLFEINREWMNRWPIELSGGELQRFCIVRSLHPETKYIIADEITTMVDAITQVKIWHAFLRLCKKRNIGLIIVSHDISLLTRLCDGIYKMD